VARSKEFQAASRALEELVRSLVVKGGWSFSDQQKILAAQKFTVDDMEALASVPRIFTRSMCQMALFTRLMQRGYAGGQPGRTSEARQASAFSRMIWLKERDAGQRVWLIYSEIKKVTGCRQVAGIFPVLSPLPGYLASVWLDSKKLLAEPSFHAAREQVTKRTVALLLGLPVIRTIARQGRALLQPRGEISKNRWTVQPASSPSSRCFRTCGTAPFRSTSQR
jgi:hypothetical protein